MLHCTIKHANQYSYHCRRQQFMPHHSDALSILFVGHSELRNSLQIVNIGTILMNEQFTRQAQEMFDLAKDASLPENFQVIA